MVTCAPHDGAPLARSDGIRRGGKPSRSGGKSDAAHGHGCFVVSNKQKFVYTEDTARAKDTQDTDSGASEDADFRIHLQLLLCDCVNIPSNIPDMSGQSGSTELS
eukprot:99171-Pyramimonas_sp.AAC.1